MLIYFYGPDSYRRIQSLNEVVVKTFEQKHSGIGSARFYLSEEGAFEKLKEFASSNSLFNPHKLAVVYQPEEADKELKNFLKDYLESKTTTIVLLADKKLTKEFDFLLKKPVTSKEFEPLQGPDLLKYVLVQAKQRGFNVSIPKVQQLLEIYSDDLWAVMTEIEKLASGGAIEERTKAPDFFPAVQSLKGAPSVGGRLKALHYLLEYYEDAFAFNMLAALVSPKQKTALADYDVQIKTGKLEYPEVLLDCAINVGP